jgi:hypothetical protein
MEGVRIVFDRHNGLLTVDGKVVSTHTWAGHGNAANDPSREREKEIGPLPAGVYLMGKMIMDGGHLGPHIIPLTQVEGDHYDRSGFFFHGDEANDTDHRASDGCMIDARNIRDYIDTISPRYIRVV